MASLLCAHRPARIHKGRTHKGKVPSRVIWVVDALARGITKKQTRTADGGGDAPLPVGTQLTGPWSLWKAAGFTAVRRGVVG